MEAVVVVVVVVIVVVYVCILWYVHVTRSYTLAKTILQETVQGRIQRGRQREGVYEEEQTVRIDRS